MSNVDNRVVEMGFDNSKFAQGVSGTLSELDKLKAALGLSGASRGLEEVSAAAGKFNSTPMEEGAHRIGGAFTAMQATVFGALTNIGSKISNTALNMTKALTVAPISSGFHEYETMMGSVQTILANTSRYGTKLPEVMSNLDELNTYADKTIYDFGQMTANIGLFTNAGIKVGDATKMIKGFSNVAAASGTNAEGAASAAYQLSQALSSGKITLMDWRSLTNVGMGNKNMQSGIIDIASAMGTFAGKGTNAKEATKDFNKTLEKGWLTSDVMSKYLKIMAGDMSVAEMKTLGLSAAQIKTFQQQQKTAEEAATKVRTFTQLLGTIKEAVGSGWTESFRTIFGDFNEATDLFTNINNAISGFVGRSADARNKLLKDWKALGGRFALIDSIKMAFQALFAILKPIEQAFRSIFPKTTGKQLAQMTFALHAFVENLLISGTAANNIKRTFAGVFAIFHIVWQVATQLAWALGSLFGTATKGSSGILEFTASLGDFFVALDKSLATGTGLNNFFVKIHDAAEKPIKQINRIIQAIGDFFNTVDLGIAGSSLGTLANGLMNFGSSADTTTKKTKTLMDRVHEFFDFLGNFAGAIANFVQPLTDGLSNAFSNINFKDVMQGMQTGLLGGLVVTLKQMSGVFAKMKLFSGSGGPGITDKLKGSIDKLTGTLSAMQQNLKANVLLKIAAAIALLAVSVILLAGVDAAGLARATAALTVMFVQLGSALQAFQKIGTTSSMVKVNLMAAALILLAIAINLMALAVQRLAGIPVKQLRDGLIGMTIMLTVMVAAAKGLNKQEGAILRASASMILLAAALDALVHVVRLLGNMDMGTLQQGLIGVGGLLAGLALFTRLASTDKASAAHVLEILALAVALNLLARVVTIFGNMSWDQLEKGFAGVAGGMIAIAAALRIMPDSNKTILDALAIAKVAGSMAVLAQVFVTMNGVSWNSIAKGLIGMGGALLIMVKAVDKMPKIGIAQTVGLLGVAGAIYIVGKAVQMIGGMDPESIGKGVVGLGLALALLKRVSEMKGSVEGAVSVLSTAEALRNLLPVLVTFGQMSIAEIATSLGMLAGVFTVLGVASWALSESVPVLTGLGIALGLLGASVFLAGAGLALFATGMAALAVSGVAGVGALVVIVSSLVGLIPMMAKQIGLGIVALIKTIADSSVALTNAFVKIVSALLDGVVKLAPKLGATLLVLIQTGLHVLMVAIPAFVTAGMRIIVGVLKGIRDNIGEIVSTAAEIGINFINALAKKLPAIIDAGIKFIISFVNGLADGIRNNSKAMGEAGGNLATAMVQGMINGLGAMAGKLIDAAKDVAKSAWNAAKDWLGIASPSKKFIQLGRYTSQGFAIGLGGNKAAIQDAVRTMTNDLSDAMAQSKKDAVDAVAQLKKLTAARTENTVQIKRAQDALNKARNRQVGSTARHADTRAAEIKRETDARNNAIAVAQERLRKLNLEQVKNTKAIKDAKIEITRATIENHKEIAARNMLTKQLADETKHLEVLANRNDVLTDKIKNAQQVLADAKKTRDDYNQSLRDQYGAQEAVTKDTKLTDYMANLRQQIVDTQKFSVAIQELRKRGLNNDMYKQLLSTGLDAMPFMQQLLAGGSSAIGDVNNLGKTLDKAAAGLGDSASKSLYQAAVDSAAGLVKGLQDQQKAIEKQMDKIADYMVNSLKKKLGIKSPSKVFAELGEFTADGLVMGLDNAAVAVGKSAEGVGTSAINGMKKTISGLGALVNANVDVNPVIAPVLDLSGVRKDAAGIGAMLNAKPLDVKTSYFGANSASAGYTRNQAAVAGNDLLPQGDTITFVQNVNSPKALSNADIYRQTNNQLSIAKGALTKRAN